ncbi:hypothetical protein [Streptomyces litchfieldiae]|uniref:Uncharacterized protein n=1 Tax=Streptomyces litchfieldiae TaxID=3075543 RepID=A0ABU2MN23_9ACTN|nr:hypothetical protein [Streptomyces sp. DSM 44938]MDT0343009.1 hypothetical protein [Streptomyces sp. DSM 44938]
MKALPVGTGVFLAVSLIALAAVLGYRTGREEVPYESIAEVFEELGLPPADEFRALHEDDEDAQRVQWIYPTIDAEGAPFFIVVTDGGEVRDTAALCAGVAAYLAEHRGIDFSGGHTEMLFTPDGEMLRHWETTP